MIPATPTLPLGLSEAFTNDQHFRAAGFVPLF
jgi:hypothetical protein